MALVGLARVCFGACSCCWILGVLVRAWGRCLISDCPLLILCCFALERLRVRASVYAFAVVVGFPRLRCGACADSTCGVTFFRRTRDPAAVGIFLCLDGAPVIHRHVLRPLTGRCGFCAILCPFVELWLSPLVLLPFSSLPGALLALC